MFDDYKFKLPKKRIQFVFHQEKEEAFYPWEIAKFLNELNTSYYKYELLNSICSAINNGISPENILILDKSLPLYQSHGELNIIDLRKNGLQILYNTGYPNSLLPSKESFELRELLIFFHSINSKLFANRYKPLYLKTLNSVYGIFEKKGLETARSEIVKEALKRSTKKRKFSSDFFDKEIVQSNKSISQFSNQFESIQKIKEKNNYKSLKQKQNKDIEKLFTVFFKNFEKIQRPVVCVRNGNKLRVLGRSLVNKKEKHVQGLELKEITRRSPFRFILEGGVAVYRTIQEEKRAKELHEKEKQIQDSRLRQEKKKELLLDIKIAKELEQISRDSDVTAYTRLPISYATEKILEEYKKEDEKRQEILDRRGLKLEPKETKSIDFRA